MSSTDLIAWVAVIFTALGLLLNYFAGRSLATKQEEFLTRQAQFQAEIQKKMEELKEGFALAREHRQLIVPAQLLELQKISDWLKESYRLVDEICELGIYWSHQDEPVWVKNFERMKADWEIWATGYSHIKVLAIQYGPAPEIALEQDSTYLDLDQVPDTLQGVVDKLGRLMFTVKRRFDGDYPEMEDEYEVMKNRARKLFSAGSATIDSTKAAIVLASRAHPLGAGQ